jgi:hypothetical protein
MRKVFILLMAWAVLLSFGAQAKASIQFVLEAPQNYGSDALRVVVTVDDDTANVLTFNVAISPTAALPNVGDLFGVFLEFWPHPTLSATTSFVGADITAVNLNSIGEGGNKLQGVIANDLVPGGTFDAAITLGASGSSGGLLLSTTFTLDDNAGAIKLDDLLGVGIRAQTIGLPPDGGEGSSKGYADTFVVVPPPPDTHAPEAASALIWAGLATVFGYGARKRLRAA